MTGHEKLTMGRKAESIYTAVKKNCLSCGKAKAMFQKKNRVSSFEEHMRRNAAPKACYVYINGISMPVLSA